MNKTRLSDLPAGEKRYWQKRLMSAFTRAGVSDRTERLCHLSLIFGRVVLSTNDLTRAELEIFRHMFYRDGQFMPVLFERVIHEQTHQAE